MWVKGGKKRLEMIIHLSHSDHQNPGFASMRRKYAEPTGSDSIPPPAQEMPSKVKTNLTLSGAKPMGQPDPDLSAPEEKEVDVTLLLPCGGPGPPDPCLSQRW